jgi:alpha-beta hydrolase superfamily lysophospholipase
MPNIVSPEIASGATKKFSSNVVPMPAIEKRELTAEVFPFDWAALNLVLALEAVRGQAIPGFKVPFCIVHGIEYDAAVPIAGSEFMMKTAATLVAEDKELHPMEGGYHDLLAEPSAEEVIGHVLTFLQKRTNRFL